MINLTIIKMFVDSKYFINKINEINSVENSQSNSGKSTKETNSEIKVSKSINSNMNENNNSSNYNNGDNNNILSYNNNRTNNLLDNNSEKNDSLNNNNNIINNDNKENSNQENYNLQLNNDNDNNNDNNNDDNNNDDNNNNGNNNDNVNTENNYSDLFGHKCSKEFNPKEVPSENISIKIKNEISINNSLDIMENDIENFLKNSNYILDNNKEENNNLNKEEHSVNRYYQDYKKYISELNGKELKNDKKILYDNFKEFIKFIDKIEKEFTNIKVNFNIKIVLFFNENKEKENGQFKNINCEYKIKSIYFNVIDNKTIFIDKDILNNDKNDKNITNFKSLLNKLNFAISSLSSLNRRSGNSSNSTQTLNYIINSLSVPSPLNIIEFLKIIRNHAECANYIKELSNGLFISGGDSKLILYNDMTYEFEDEILIKNHNIFELENNEKDINIIICSDKENIKQINIINNSKSFQVINEKANIKSRIFFKFNKDYIICNIEGIFLKNDLFSTITISNQTSILKKSYWTGIQINSKIIALISNKTLSNGEDKLIFYNYYSKRIIKYFENYSFTLSQNNLTLMPKIDTTNKILLCACKKYKEGQKNGILLLKLNLSNNFQVLSNKFYETKNFEVYCFCPISKFYNINDLNFVLKKNNKMIETDFFLVGGLNLENNQGMIKLYKVNYNKKKFEKTEIEFVKDIEIKPNDENNPFDGFKGAITCIIQSKYNGNILVTCSDGNVILFTIPNVSFY